MADRTRTASNFLREALNLLDQGSDAVPRAYRLVTRAAAELKPLVKGDAPERDDEDDENAGKFPLRQRKAESKAALVRMLAKFAKSEDVQLRAEALARLEKLAPQRAEMLRRARLVGNTPETVVRARVGHFSVSHAGQCRA